DELAANASTFPKWDGLATSNGALTVVEQSATSGFHALAAVATGSSVEGQAYLGKDFKQLQDVARSSLSFDFRVTQAGDPGRTVLVASLGVLPVGADAPYSLQIVLLNGQVSIQEVLSGAIAASDLQACGAFVVRTWMHATLAIVLEGASTARLTLDQS